MRLQVLQALEGVDEGWWHWVKDETSLGEAEMGQGGGMMQLPSGACKDLLPLILPLLLSSASTPLSLIGAPSLLTFGPLFVNG